MTDRINGALRSDLDAISEAVKGAVSNFEAAPGLSEDIKTLNGDMLLNMRLFLLKTYAEMLDQLIDDGVKRDFAEKVVATEFDWIIAMTTLARNQRLGVETHPGRSALAAAETMRGVQEQLADMADRSDLMEIMVARGNRLVKLAVEEGMEEAAMYETSVQHLELPEIEFEGPATEPVEA